MTSIPAPTPDGFLQFVRNAMNIDASVLPDDSIYLVYAYEVAITLVNMALPAPMYTLAVYNLAASNLLNFAMDTPPSTYFADMRKKLGIDSFVAGVVSSVSDEGTSTSLTVPDFFKNMTIGDLQLLKDPYGRRYLNLAQQLGTNWGLTQDIRNVWSGRC